MVCEYKIHAAIRGILKAKNEQYLTSLNPIYAKYTEGLRAEEVSSAAQLGNGFPCQSCMHVVSRILFMLAMLLLSQRQQANGPVLAAASPLFLSRSGCHIAVEQHQHSLSVLSVA